MLILSPFRLFIVVAHRFRHERCTQVAAALSFVSLLGLVPLIAVGFTIVSMLPPGVGMGHAIEKFLLANLLPDKAGIVIAKYFGKLAGRVDGVTFYGVLALGVTALMQMMTIERIFNHLWRIKKSRSFLKQIAIHGLVMTIGPLLLGGSLIAVTMAVRASFGLIDEPSWVRLFVLKSFTPFFFMALLFSLLYWAVPNKAVHWFHASLGGVVAALGLVGLQKIFALFIVSIVANTALYGVFSAVPVFLLWLYASWLIVLVAALIVAELPQ